MAKRIVELGIFDYPTADYGFDSKCGRVRGFTRRNTKKARRKFDQLGNIISVKPRKPNQDAMGFVIREDDDCGTTIYTAVADGVSGCEDGALAASVAVKVLVDEVIRSDNPYRCSKEVYKLITNIRSGFLGEMDYKELSEINIATTLVVGIIYENRNRIMSCAGLVGDSSYEFIKDDKVIEASVPQIFANKDPLLAKTYFASQPTNFISNDTSYHEDAPNVGEQWIGTNGSLILKSDGVERSAEDFLTFDPKERPEYMTEIGRSNDDATVVESRWTV